MIRERLTLAQCAPGVKVVCVDAAGRLITGATYAIDDFDCINGGRVFLPRPHFGPWNIDRFTLAPAPPAPVVLTDELRAALVAWYRAWGGRPGIDSEDQNLLAAIEATPNLLPDPAPPPPGTTDALQIEGWM